MLFSDLFELDHVLEWIEELARAPATLDLVDLHPHDSYIRTQVRRVRRRITAVEVKHRLAAGASYQAQMMALLDRLLGACRYPPDLAAKLPVVRELLCKAQIIDLELQNGIITTAARVGEKVIGGLQARQDQKAKRAFQRWIKDNAIRVTKIDQLLDRSDFPRDCLKYQPETLRIWYGEIFPRQLRGGRPKKNHR